MKKRILSFVLVCCMMLTLVPTAAFAVESKSAKSAIDIWDGSIANGFASGNGTKDDPYIIETAAQLAFLSTIEMGQYYRYYGKYYKLINDIYLNDVAGWENWDQHAPSNVWSPIGSFKGHFNGFFDGDGHVISGVYINSSEDYQGLFAGICHGGIKNLGIVDSYIKGNDYVGGLAGQKRSNSSFDKIEIENCYFLGNIFGNSNVGGIVGYNYEIDSAMIENCQNFGSINGVSNVGGIAGLECCYNNGPVTGTSFVGGIVGYNTCSYAASSYIRYCYNTGTVKGNASVGGIAGSNQSTSITLATVWVENCYNIGTVNGNYYTGGIIGYNRSAKGSSSSCGAYLKNSYNVGTVYGKYYNAGGVVGYNSDGTAFINNCYYLRDCAADGYGVEQGGVGCNSSGSMAEDKNGVTTKLLDEEMQKQESFAGFDFDTVWGMPSEGTYQYPTLISNPHFEQSQQDDAYCYVVVLDIITHQPINGVRIAEAMNNNMVSYTASDGKALICDAKVKFSTTLPLRFTKSGYKDFMCYYKDLEVSDVYSHWPTNYIYMVPDGEELTEDIKKQIYIGEHVNFINNKYESLAKLNGFYNTVWQYEDGKRLWACYLWDIIGDFGEVVTLKFDDLTISADYYDLFISDLILTLSNNELDDRLMTKAFNSYEKTYGLVTNNIITTLIEVVEKDELLQKEITELIDGNSTTNKTWQEVLADVKLLGKDLDKLLSGKEYEMDAATKIIYKKFFEKVLQDDSIYSSLFEGACAANTISSLYTDALDFATDIADSYILAKSCGEVNQELFNILFATADEMSSINSQYSTWFRRDLYQYYNIAISESALMLYLIKESSLDLATLIYNRSINDVTKNIAYKFISEKLGMTIPTLKILVATYNGTYKFINLLLRTNGISEQYYLMNYIAPVEKALSKVVNNYGETLTFAQTYNNAENLDLAYNMLRYTNKYLYECAYNFGTLTNNLEDLKYATYYKNMWNLTMCHTPVISDRSKYISIQCPVDIYIYDSDENVVLAIVNEEVIAYNDASITIMNCDGKKSIMYPADADYSVRIVSRNDGTMDYYVVETEGIDSVRDVEFYDLPLSKGKVYTGNIPHEFGVGKEEYALQTTDGSVLCDYDSSDSTECNINGHSYGEWIMEVEPSINAAGLKKHSCSVCGKTEKASIQPLKASIVIKTNPQDLSIVEESTGNSLSVEAETTSEEELLYQWYTCDDGDGNNPQALDGETHNIFYLPSYTLPADLDSNSYYYFCEVSTATIDAVETNVACVTVTKAGGEDSHVHNWATEWSSDSTQHWHICLTQEDPCGERKDVGEHVYDNDSDDTCNICGYLRTVVPPIRNNTITFDANGGTVTPANVVTNNDGRLPVLPAPARNGYIFNGWYTSANAGTKITTNTVFEADTTVYAQWSIQNIPGSGSSGGSGASGYGITIPKIDNGSISVSPKSAKKGDTVTITVKPDVGYELDSLTVTDKNGDAVKLTKKSDTQYTFVMPDSKVNMEASFVKIIDSSESLPFTDVAASAYYYDAVKWAAAEGITGGTTATTFSPNAPCTRAQIVTFLWRAAGSPAPHGNVTGFEDVAENAYYADAVLWAAEQGITGGIGNGKFSPDATCTRSQSVTFLYRAAGSPAVSSSAAFCDVTADNYYANAVAWAAQNGVTGGIGEGLFGPANDCTRAQIVTFLYRWLVK